MPISPVSVLRLGAVCCAGQFAAKVVYQHVNDTTSDVNLDIQEVFGLLGAGCGFLASCFEDSFYRRRILCLASAGIVIIWLVTIYNGYGKFYQKDEERAPTWIQDRNRDRKRQQMFRTVVSITSFGAFLFAVCFV